MGTTPSGPERRVDDLGREAFERAVALAATQATRAVARVHRRRLVAQAGIVTFVVCAGFALALAFVFSSEIRGANRANSLYNCRLIRAVSVPLAAFVASDATLRRHELAVSLRDQRLLSAYRRLLGGRELAKVLSEYDQLDRDTQSYWRNQVVPQLNLVAGQDCQLHVR